MTDAQTLLNEVLANPADREPRLVYADWLLDQGDLRGEFIQLQVEAEKLSQFDPVRKKLESKARKLLKEHGGPGNLPAGVKNFEYTAGFVEWVELTIRQFLKVGEELFAGSPVRDVDLVGVDMRKLSKSPLLERPEGVVLKKSGETWMGDERLHEFVTSPRVANLKRLTIMSHWLGMDSIESIASTPHLGSLEELHIYNNGIGDFGPMLAAAESLRDIRELTAFQNDGAEFTDKSLIAIGESEKFARLKKLSFNGTLTQKGCRAFVDGGFEEPLERLDLMRCTLQGDAPVTLVSSERLASLKWLTLEDLNKTVSNKVVQAIAGSMRNLEVLDLDNCAVTDKGAELLAQSRALASIKRLHFKNNQLTVRGIRALAESRDCPMKDTFLSGNNISDDEIQALQSDYGKQFGRF